MSTLIVISLSSVWNKHDSIMHIIIDLLKVITNQSDVADVADDAVLRSCYDGNRCVSKAVR